MNAYLSVGLACILIWVALVYGGGIGAGVAHILVAVGFVLVARGLLQTETK